MCIKRQNLLAHEQESQLNKLRPHLLEVILELIQIYKYIIKKNNIKEIEICHLNWLYVIIQVYALTPYHF